MISEPKFRRPQKDRVRVDMANPTARWGCRDRRCVALRCVAAGSRLEQDNRPISHHCGHLSGTSQAGRGPGRLRYDPRILRWLAHVPQFL